MGFQFEQLTLSAHRSLSFLVEDISRARRDGLVYGPADREGLQTWLNALQDYAAPLVHSESGRRGIERWLDTVAAETEGPSTAG